MNGRKKKEKKTPYSAFTLFENATNFNLMRKKSPLSPPCPLHVTINIPSGNTIQLWNNWRRIVPEIAELNFPEFSASTSVSRWCSMSRTNVDGYVSIRIFRSSTNLRLRYCNQTAKQKRKILQTYCYGSTCDD